MTWLVPVTCTRLVRVDDDEAGDEYDARALIHEMIDTMDIEIELSARAASAVRVEVGHAYVAESVELGLRTPVRTETPAHVPTLSGLRGSRLS